MYQGKPRILVVEANTGGFRTNINVLQEPSKIVITNPDGKTTEPTSPTSQTTPRYGMGSISASKAKMEGTGK